MLPKAVPSPVGCQMQHGCDERALAVSYYSSPEYLKMSSKSVRRNIIVAARRHICAVHEPLELSILVLVIDFAGAPYGKSNPCFRRENDRM
jgi:hypothetical protein